jgi:hypothetical protein
MTVETSHRPLTEPIPTDLSLDWIAGKLASLPSDDSPETRDSNTELLTQLSQRATFVPFLQRLVADDKDLDAVAARSYRHVNHFDKIVLAESAERLGYRLTLHLWRPPYTESEINEELIHDHRFSFWSAILAGTLVSENFEVSPDGPDGKDFRQYQFIPEKHGATTAANFYAHVGDVRLAKKEPSRETAGGVYHLRHEAIHRVVLPRRDLTCTLVLRGPRVRPYANVFNTVYPTQDTRMDNPTFHGGQLRDKLTALLGTIPRA